MIDSDRLLLRSNLLGAVEHHGGTDHDGSVGSDEDTEDESDAETSDALAAEDCDGNHRKEG